jgi:GGDEF domain-containing protein
VVADDRYIVKICSAALATHKRSMTTDTEYSSKRTSNVLITFFVTLLCLLAAYGMANQPADYGFRYWSFFDPDNVSLETIQTIPNEDWTPLDGNTYQTHLFDRDFWKVASNPILWLKIEIPRRIKEDALWLELVPNTGVDGLLIQNIDDRWQWIPAEGRNRESLNHVPVNYLTFKLDPKTDTKTAYLKLNTSQVFNFSINIHDYSSLMWTSLYRNLFTGLVLGALALAFCYNLAVGSAAGERVYILYAAYIAAMFFYILVYNGYLRVISPEWGGQGMVARSMVYIVVYAATSFVREFFNTKALGGLFDQVLKVAQRVILISLVISLFINDYYAFMLNDTVSIVTMIIAFFSGIYAFRKGHPLAKIYLFAWSFFLAGGLIWSLSWLGFVKPTLLAPNMMLLGTAIEVGLLSLVLSYRYSFLKETSEKLARQYQKYQDLSETDELTGILNRRGFLKQAEDVIATNQGELAWLSIDIDNFKRFNDENGHIAGDQLLSEFGNMLSARQKREELAAKLITIQDERAPQHSIFGRVGGEEFVIILLNTSMTQARLYADRLLKEFEEIEVPDHQGNTYSSTLSVGGTMLRGTDTIESIWRRADESLYTAKASGRNQAIFVD